MKSIQKILLVKTLIICRDVFRIQSRNYSEVFFTKKVDDDKDELFFVVWLTDKKRLVFCPAEAIIRDSHHRKSLTRCEQDLNLS